MAALIFKLFPDCGRGNPLSLLLVPSVHHVHFRVEVFSLQRCVVDLGSFDVVGVTPQMDITR